MMSTAPTPAQIIERLARSIPDPECELHFESPWQLLIATILSAQSTDKTINEVTPALFARWPTPAALGAADQADVEELVRRTGFFRNKAKNIRAASARIADEHDGVVPRDMAAVVALPGVARKTANLVLGTAYGIPTGMIVDTHAGRVARRLGLTDETKADKVERDLCATFETADWIDTSHRFVLHGRYVCKKRKPACWDCILADVCPSREAP